MRAGIGKFAGPGGLFHSCRRVNVSGAVFLGADTAFVPVWDSASQNARPMH